MPLPLIGPLIASVKAAPAAWAAGTYIASNLANLWMQKKNYDFQKSSYQESLVREDEAVRRRMRDLQMAGLSPTLAAGSSATTQSGFRAEAPQVKGLDLMNLMQGQKQLVIADKQAKLLDAQALKLDSETQGIKLDNAKKGIFNVQYDQRLVAELSNLVASATNKDANTLRAQIATAIDNHDYAIFDAWNLPTSTRAKITEILAAANAASGALGNAAHNTNEMIKGVDAIREKTLGEGGSKFEWRPGESESDYRRRLEILGKSRTKIEKIVQTYKQ